MKQYDTGKVYPSTDNNSLSPDYAIHQSAIEWQEGKWTVDVFGGASLDLLHTAQQVDDFLKTSALPPTDGFVAVYPNLTGNPVTRISWVYGNVMYSCQSASLMTALQIAVSMRGYPNGQVSP